MGSLTDFGESALVQHIIGEAAYTPVATVYLALCTADPTDAATGASMSEVANAEAYARVAITFSAAATRRITQTGTVTFATATGVGWGTASHWAIVDNITYGLGNVLAAGAFGTPKAIVSGNTPSVATTEVYVEITASTGLSDYVANGFLDRMFRNQAFTVAANYLALATAVIVDADTGTSITEVSGGSYARLLINAPLGGAPQWVAESAGASSNAEAWTLASATASWGTVTSACICDAATLGNLLMYDNTNVVDQLVSDGDTVQFATGDFDFSQS